MFDYIFTKMLMLFADFHLYILEPVFDFFGWIKFSNLMSVGRDVFLWLLGMLKDSGALENNALEAVASSAETVLNSANWGHLMVVGGWAVGWVANVAWIDNLLGIHITLEFLAVAVRTVVWTYHQFWGST